MGRKRKLEHFAEMKTFAHVVEAQMEEVFNKPHELQAKWNTVFFSKPAPIVLELGCGKGEYTVGLAQKYPDCNYLGVDIKGARMWRGAKTADEIGLKNVGFLRTKVEFIASFFAEGEVSEIWLTFSDPQVKKPLKRLTSSRFLARYQKILTDGGIVHLKTDSQLLYEYTRAVVAANELEVLHDVSDIYTKSIVNEVTELNIRTHYEKMWLRDGYAINYLSFRLPREKSFIEPEFEFDGERR